MSKQNREDKVIDLIERYDKARRLAKEADDEKKELGEQLKAFIGTKEEYSVTGWTYTYRYDKDKEIEVFDEVTFSEKEPKRYAGFVKAKEALEKMMKKYVKKSTQKGARRLIIERKED